MCELIAAVADEPFRLGDLWDVVAALERYGVAGFGWGVAWPGPDGRLMRHVSTAAFRDDPATDALATLPVRACMVHLRRPSKLSTLSIPDAQPFLDPAGRFAFCHNGDLARWRPARATYAAAGRIAGRADSEVGQRWLEDAWAEHALELAWPRSDGAPGSVADARGATAVVPDPCVTLGGLHDALGGQANLCVLTPDGAVHCTAGNTENPIVAYRLGGLRVVSTAIYSIDRSVFRLVAPGARERRVHKPGSRIHLLPVGA
ncbi:MAG: class II glutamine amidotransferase [Chloroflexota bacterium]